MEGRFEKRLPAKIPVRLLAADFRSVLEWTVTTNVSPGGARVKTRLSWPANEQIGVASLASGFNVRAKVVYCEPQPSGDFHLGLDFRPAQVDWQLFART
jgi:PilZ domain-containing protein